VSANSPVAHREAAGGPHRPPVAASALALILYARAGRVSLADGIALMADCLTVATLPGEQQAMAGLFSEIFSSTLNGLVSAALALAAVAEMGQRFI
jgi:hypothetical protein